MSAERLGFGCAGLLQIPSAKARRALLEEAFDRGLRHFDVARMYGLGQAEGEVGHFARGRRDQLRIATKFGIEPSGALGRLAPLQAPARAVVARLPRLRALLRRKEGAMHDRGDYSPARARASLETSLRELGIDHVDLFLVHGPGPRDAIEVPSLAATLEGLREAGLIGAWGFAGAPETCRGLAAATARDPVLQLADSVLAPAAEPGERAPDIVFGALSGALAAISAHVAADPARRVAWSERVGVDCGDATRLAPLLLAEALDRQRRATVLFATTRPERIGAALAAPGLGADLDAFRALVRAELGSLARVA